jgi:hypothetical protein
LVLFEPGARSRWCIAISTSMPPSRAKARESFGPSGAIPDALLLQVFYGIRSERQLMG